MGKWAQTARRGTASSTPTALPPPGAPTWGLVGDTLFAQTSSPGNLGGRIYVEVDYGKNGSWEPFGSAPNPTYEVGDITIMDSGYYRAREEGNNVNYLGFSTWSDSYEV